MSSRSQEGMMVAPPRKLQGQTLQALLVVAALLLTALSVRAVDAQQEATLATDETTMLERVAVAADSAGVTHAAADVETLDDKIWAQSLASAGEVSLMPLIFKVCLGLGLVIGLAWGSVWLLRRTTLGQGAVGAGSLIKVKDRTWLGPKKAIFLVDIDGRTLALGVTEEHINVLSSWEPGQIDTTVASPTAPGAFAVQLRSLLGKSDAVAQGGGA